MSTRGSKGSRSAYWGSENKPAPTPTPAPTPVANAVEATPEPVQPKQAEVLKTEVQNAMQTVINTIVAAEEKQKTAGTTATKDVTDALTAAQNKAKEIGDKYGVDISKLVNEATRAVESGNADASARLEKALTSKQTDIDNIVRDITTRTSTNGKRNI
jgi:vacuolar-type H+-ATPase subunit H